MNNTDKIRISYNLIFEKILFVAALIFCVTMIVRTKTADGDFDLKTLLEYKLGVLVCLMFLIYFFTRPDIYYDDSNFYIKRLNKKELKFPLKNVSSIFKNPLTTSKGTVFVTIEYLDGINETSSIKFLVPYYNSKLSNFTNHVKSINPSVEIV